MTQSPNLGNEPEPPTPPRRRFRLPHLNRPLAIAGIVLLAGTAAGAVWAWIFVHERLAPLVQENLSQTLKRPVNLGRVERFSINSLRFGRSSIPATPTDPDNVTIETVEVAFDPLQLLFTRTLRLDVTAIKPTAYIEQAKDNTWISTQISDEERAGLIKTEVEVFRLEDAQVTLLPLPKSGQRRIAIGLQEVDGLVNFFDQYKRIRFEVDGRSIAGGMVDLKGETLRATDQTALMIRAQDFPLVDLDRIVKLPINLKQGRADGNLLVEFAGFKNRPQISGTAQVRNATVQIPKVPKLISKARGELQFQGSRLILQNTRALYDKVPARARGLIDFEKGLDIAIQVQPVNAVTALQALDIKPPVPVSGEVRADLRLTGLPEKAVLLGIARTTKPSRIDRVDITSGSAAFKLDAAAQLLSLGNIRAVPAAGGLVVGAGQVKIGQPSGLVLDFLAQGVAADAIARAYNNGNPVAVTLGRVAARAQVFGPLNNLQTVVRWRAPEATYPATGEILVAGNNTFLRNTTLSVAGGTVNAQARLANGRWQALVRGAGIQLSRFSPDLRGQFSGNFNLTGTLASFRPESIRAQGQARFSQGISLINDPLTAAVQWDGQKIQVRQAVARGFNANGTILAQLEGAGAPAITGLDLNVRTQDLDLRTLPISLPGATAAAPPPLTGQADFAGRLTGTPASPNVVGALRLNNFALNNVAFESPMTGSLSFSGARGVNLQVAGTQDRVALVTNQNFRPIAFDIRQGETVATGTTRNGLLYVTARNFPLSILPISSLAAAGTTIPQPIAGSLSTDNLVVNLNKPVPEIVGNVEIANPILGRIRGDRFIGQLSYTNGVASLAGGELQQGNTRLLLEGTFDQRAENPFTGKLRIAQSSIQEILATLQIFDLDLDVLPLLNPNVDVGTKLGSPQYDRASSLRPFLVPAGLPNASLLTQIRRLSEIQALLKQERAERQNALIPELRDLQGTLTGEITVQGSPQNGVALRFDLLGQNWQWGSSYLADQVVINGSFDRGVVTLLPLRLQSADSFVSFSGQIGGAQQSGQFQMRNFPVDAITNIISRFNPLPFDVQGRLNATATLSGTQANPVAIGAISLEQATLNGTPIRSGQGNFNYRDARLGFSSEIAIVEQEPVRIAGSFPYPVQPGNNQFNFNVNVQNEGLALLNLLTPQITWVDGQGNVQLNALGTLREDGFGIATLNTSGNAVIDNATLEAQALPGQLKNVTVRADFARDRVLVNQAQGNFGQGNIIAQGVIPLTQPLASSDPDRNNPLTVDLKNLEVTLRGLFRGGVNGRLAIGGTALDPEIGGEIRLSRGQVLLPDTSNTATTGTTGATEPPSRVEFNDLQLILDRGIVITRQPILTFGATGQLTLNGTLDDLRPAGEIRLRGGQVNLFYTQFNLARGYNQIATFTPRQGLDPNLDIRLIALVPEVTRSRLPTTTIASEISDAPTIATNLGSFQTVRIQARVMGPASQLFNNLELTSSPSRSREEIVGLLGGGFVNTLGRGDSTLGIANLAGSALLTNVQTFISNVLGLGEFRLYPTISPNDDEKSRGSTLGLAAELGFDITQNVSASISKILTNDQSPQIGVRYRLNDQVLLRGAVDFSGNSIGIVEYEARF